MIVVDTSVWIDLLNGVESERAVRCTGLIRDGAPVALTDIVLTEVLQGLRTDREAQLVASRLRAFPILRLQALEDFALAASLYRTARHQGVTVRRTLDCLIAAVCVREDVAILHGDADFDRLAGCTALRVFA
ncbi:MAG: PIN domain nuclease [Solirubrobacteraceae bacterium MAG38_C4-C5]|nr:PIN domain nuclease [Candidatus Siliceabacter maunaloa]